MSYEIGFYNNGVCEHYAVVPNGMGFENGPLYDLMQSQFVVRMSINMQSGKVTSLEIGSYGKPIGTYFTPDEIRTIVNRQEFVSRGGNSFGRYTPSVNISTAMSIIDNFITMNPGISRNCVDIVNDSNVRFESYQMYKEQNQINRKERLRQIMLQMYNDSLSYPPNKRYMFMIHCIKSIQNSQIGHAVTLVADLNSLPVHFKVFDSQRPVGISDSDYGSYIHINVNNNDLSYKGLLNPTRYDGYNYSPQPIDANDCTYWAEATVLELNKLVTNKFNHKGEFIVLDGLALNFNNPDFRKQLEDRKKMLEDKAVEHFMDCEDAGENVSKIAGLGMRLDCAIEDIEDSINKSSDVDNTKKGKGYIVH